VGGGKLFYEDVECVRSELICSSASQGQIGGGDCCIARNVCSLLKGIDRMLPAGDYQVVTDEELIEGISFPARERS